jgi:TATA-box binding protein (TBP) (component of TFIID and TFIIIB)
LNIFISKDKQINFKIFKNGKIQITGVPEETVAKECIHAFIQYIYEQKLIDSILQYNNFRTVLINSDYFCGIQINRDNLFKIMTKKLNLTVSYESENYPGVKVAYFYNKKYVHTCHEGTCACTKRCIGKGKSALLEKNCKRITVAIFQSGKIIITGANSLEQIHCAYQFINKIIQDHYYFVVKKNNIEIKTYKIKISSIKNYKDYETLLQM